MAPFSGWPGCSEPVRKLKGLPSCAAAAQPIVCCDDIQADLPCAAQACGRSGSGEREFKLGEALAYIANMRTFWMITVGLGEPPLLQRLPCALVPCDVDSLLWAPMTQRP